MASHPYSHNFPQPGSTLLRQPSAEDIDAAHQLVSSARGEMTGTYVNQEINRSDASAPSVHTQAPQQPTQSVEPPSPLPIEEQQQLGQVCRSVSDRPIRTWPFTSLYFC